MTLQDHYDYIIVGAGSAGCVLANRLTESGNKTALILEAGPMDRNLLIHIPAGVYKVYTDPALNWNYRTEAEAELNNRRIDQPRGRVVGGSSSINSMVYMRGHPLDYDGWANDPGLTQWCYANCLPYFRASESSDRGADMWRGDSGPLGVSRGDLDNPLYDAFLDAGVQAGQGSSEDLNGFKPEGLARLDATKKNGKRCSAAAAYLHPALKRAGLTLITDAMVERVLLSSDRATGIQFSHCGVSQRVSASREIILCGGAINSPQLLMLSGIGPADHLREHGIDVALDLPGVGQNLQDHASMYVQYRCREPVTIHAVSRPLNKLRAGLRWGVDRSGIAASSIWEAGGLVRSNVDVAWPNVQYHFAPVGIRHENGKLKLNQAFTISIDLLRPESSGEIRLKSANPMQKPALHFNYLSTSRDRREMLEAVRCAGELIRQPAFDPYRGAPFGPINNAETDDELLRAIRAMAETDYHPCGTCRMGHDARAVVDDALRVHGIAGLRVVDASVMPRVISANLNAPTQMIAARAADFIAGNQQRAPEHAPFHFRSSYPAVSRVQ